MTEQTALVKQENVKAIEGTATEVQRFNSDVSQFDAGRALEAMYPDENLVEKALEIARKFDPSSDPLAISGFGPSNDQSAVSRKILSEVRGHETGPAQQALDEFTGVATSIDPTVLTRKAVTFLRIHIWDPLKAFMRSVQKAQTLLDAGQRNLEVQRVKLVEDLSSMESLKEAGESNCKDMLIYACAAEAVTEAQEKRLAQLKAKNDPNDLNLPAEIDAQQSIVNRMNRKTLDLKASAMRALLSAKVADAGQKSLVILHDDIKFAVEQLYPQFADMVASAIILYRGKTLGEQGQQMRKATADLSEITAQLLGDVSSLGEAYLTQYEEDVRGLVAFRNAVLKWSQQAQDVGAKVKQARAEAERQMQAISESLQKASRAYATE